MKVIITGATGFVGAHLVRHYAGLGHEVIAIGRQETPPTSLLRYASWIKLDLTDNQFPVLESDIIIHGAGLASDRGTYQSFYKNNVLPTEKLYQHFKGKHFICISSASVYPHLDIPIKEEDANLNNVVSNYGRSKLEAENILIKNQRDACKITILRPRSIYGTNDRILLPKILRLYKNKIRLIGSMDIPISMTHISNLIEAIDGSISNQKTHLEIFNVADREVYVLSEVVTQLTTEIAGKELKSKILRLNLIRIITKLTYTLKIPFPLTPQSLNYLSKPCVLNADKITHSLKINLSSNFNSELNKMVSWIDRVGVEKVKSADPLLPWLGLNDNIK